MAAEIRGVNRANAFSKQNIRESPAGPRGYALLIWGTGKHGLFRMFLPGRTQVRTKSAEYILGTAAARRAAHAHFWHFAGTVSQVRDSASPPTRYPSVNNPVPTGELAGPGLQVLFGAPGTCHIICFSSFPHAQNGKPPWQQHCQSS